MVICVCLEWGLTAGDVCFPSVAVARWPSSEWKGWRYNTLFYFDVVILHFWSWTEIQGAELYHSTIRSFIAHFVRWKQSFLFSSKRLNLWPLFTRYNIGNKISFESILKCFFSWSIWKITNKCNNPFIVWCCFTTPTIYFDPLAFRIIKLVKDVIIFWELHINHILFSGCIQLILISTACGSSIRYIGILLLTIGSTRLGCGLV